MKRLLLAFGLLIAGISSSFATCTGPAVMHDFPGTAFNMSLATNAGDGNCASNVGIVGTVPLPTGAATSANQSTEITALNSIVTNTGAAIPVGTNVIGKVTTDQTTHGTTDLIAADITKIAGVATVADPCQTATKVYTPVNVVTATNVIITAVAAKKKYICGIFLYPGGTDNIAVYQATTATSCATAAADIFGGHTTGTGFLATAQAGFVVGNGASAIAATNTVNTDICITTSAAVQLSGVVVTVDQ